jgi:hypothetical protein
MSHHKNREVRNYPSVHETLPVDGAIAPERQMLIGQNVMKALKHTIGFRFEMGPNAHDGTSGNSIRPSAIYPANLAGSALRLLDRHLI